MTGMQWRGGLLLLLGACAGSIQGPNGLQRSLLQVELTARQAEKQQLERKLWSLDQEIVDDYAKAQLAQEESWRTEARLRERTAELDRQVRTLQAAEQDLQAALVRKAEIEAELAAVRELEEQLAQKDLRLAELAAQMEASQARLAEKEAEHSQQQEAVAARFVELEERSKVLDSLKGLVQKALQEVLILAGPFFTKPGEDGKQDSRNDE